MIRKILIPLFSLAILLTGAYAFRKLNYWERSVSIFSYKTFDRRFEGRGGRGDRVSREFEGRGERGPGEFEGRGERTPGDFEGRRDRSQGDLTRRDAGRRPEFEGRSDFRPGSRDGGGHGRGDSRRGKAVRLRNVLWFLAVFGAFTAFAVYVDRMYLKIRQRKFGSS